TSATAVRIGDGGVQFQEYLVQPGLPTAVVVDFLPPRGIRAVRLEAEWPSATWFRRYSHIGPRPSAPLSVAELSIPIWSLFLPLPGGSLAGTILDVRAKRAARREGCPACGYDVRGLPAGSACPECGSAPA